MTDASIITSSILKEWQACTDCFRRFCELFPNGADLKTAAEKLAEDGHSDWSIWLFEQCRPWQLNVAECRKRVAGNITLRGISK